MPNHRVNKCFRSIPERNKLINDHLYLAIYYAKKKHTIVPPFISYYDLLSAAYDGLVNAAILFNPDMIHPSIKNPFAYYAKFRIRGSINDYLRYHGGGKRIKYTTSLNANEFEKENSHDHLLVSKSTNIVDEINSSELFNKIIRALPAYVRQIFKLYYFKHLNMKEIGEILGLTEGRVSQILSYYTDFLGKSLQDRKHSLFNEAKKTNYL